MAKVKKEEKPAEVEAPKEPVKAAHAAAPRVRAATRAGRLLPKNKSRLPRKAKKALQSKAAKQASAAL
jgi:hypothetical protein